MREEAEGFGFKVETLCFLEVAMRYRTLRIELEVNPVIEDTAAAEGASRVVGK